MNQRRSTAAAADQARSAAAVRPLGPTDLGGAARLHRECLPDGFFARLGPAFLRSYHAAFVTSPHGIALASGPDGDPHGFLVGTLDNRLHYRTVVRRRGWRLAVRGAVSLACRPPLAWLFLRTRAARYLRWALRYPFRRASGADVETPPEASAADRQPARTVAVLTHVAVAAAARGTGAGRDLVERFVAEARAAGADEARLVTPLDGDAEGFYTRLGWTPGETRRGSNGDAVREFRLVLRPSHGPEQASGQAAS